MELLAELEADYARLEELISAISRTNNSTRVESGAILSDLLARRDCLKGKLSILRGFLDSASALAHRHSVSEIKIKSTVNVRQLQKQVDGLSRDTPSLLNGVPGGHALHLSFWLRERRASSPNVPGPRGTLYGSGRDLA